MTNQHLSREQLEKYRDRVLAPGELSAIDGHLGRCSQCRDQLAASVAPTTAVSLLSSVRDARSEHLTYEQMDAWVEDELDQTERELVVAHVGLCASCAHQLRAYEQAAPAMSAPVAPVVNVARPTIEPAKLAKVGWGERLRSVLLSPQTAIVVAALVAIAIIAPYLALRPGSSGEQTSITTGDPLDLSPLETLPEVLRNGARALTTSETPELPPVLETLPQPQGPDLQYPRLESVEGTQPILRWMAFGSSYNVAVLDAQGMTVAHMDGLTATEWQVPVALMPGAVYTWQVSAEGRTESASFRILDEGQAGLIMAVRASHAGSHLALGAVAYQFGMLRDAEREFDALAREYPTSAKADRLLRTVRTLRNL